MAKLQFKFYKDFLSYASLPSQFSETVYSQCSYLPKNVALWQLKLIASSGQTCWVVLVWTKKNSGLWKHWTFSQVDILSGFNTSFSEHLSWKRKKEKAWFSTFSRRESPAPFSMVVQSMPRHSSEIMLSFSSQTNCLSRQQLQHSHTHSQAQPLTCSLSALCEVWQKELGTTALDQMLSYIRTSNCKVLLGPAQWQP